MQFQAEVLEIFLRHKKNGNIEHNLDAFFNDYDQVTNEVETKSNPFQNQEK